MKSSDLSGDVWVRSFLQQQTCHLHTTLISGPHERAPSPLHKTHSRVSIFPCAVRHNLTVTRLWIKKISPESGKDYMWRGLSSCVLLLLYAAAWTAFMGVHFECLECVHAAKKCSLGWLNTF